MESVTRAATVLREAEAALRGLVSEAARSGDYGSVVQIAAWARIVSELVHDAPGRALQARTPASQPKLGKAKPAPRRTRPASGEYPRFIRQGDQLIRIAWSKKEKKEYQHKAPYVMLRALTNAMAKIGTDGRVFSTEQLLPLHDTSGSEIPSYQVYVGIALMKHMALIDQHGRQGYSIPRLTEFMDAVEAVWQKLPKR